MPDIRPISDLRNKFSEISQAVHETGEPIFLTKKGSGDMVVMSMDTYERISFENTIYAKLKEAETQAASTDTRYAHDVVFSQLRERIDKGEWDV